MEYLEVEHLDGNHYRIEWNGASTYNLQIPVGGEWVDFECFTCYGHHNRHDAMEYALDWMLKHVCEEEEEDL